MNSFKVFRHSPVLDLAKLIPTSTNEGRKVFVNADRRSIIVNYEVERGRPKPVRLRRFVKWAAFVSGVLVWSCEGSRRRSTNYLEVTNGSEVPMKLFSNLLKELGVMHLVRAKVHSPSYRVEVCQTNWQQLLGSRLKFSRPIISKKTRREVVNGILHLRVYSKTLKALFEYWTMLLPRFFF